MAKEPPIAFFPSVRSLIPQLFSKKLTNKRVRVQILRITRIFSSEELCSS
jgi:hypothetical protein